MVNWEMVYWKKIIWEKGKLGNRILETEYLETGHFGNSK